MLSFYLCVGELVTSIRYIIPINTVELLLLYIGEDIICIAQLSWTFSGLWLTGLYDKKKYHYN